MKYEVKELSVGEILDQAIRVVRDHYKFLATLGLIPFVPGLIMAVVMASVYPSLREQLSGEVTMADVGLTPMKAGLLLLSAIVLTLANALCSGAAAWGVTNRYLGNDVPFGDCLNVIRRRFWGLLGASLLYAFAVGLGSMCCTIPGVYLILIWFVMYPALVFEDLGVIDAMRRSRDLMKGQLGKAFVLAFLVGIILVASNIFSQLVPNKYATALIAQSVQTAGFVFNAIVATVMYISVRCHHEQFDLQLLTQTLEQSQHREEQTL